MGDGQRCPPSLGYSLTSMIRPEAFSSTPWYSSRHGSCIPTAHQATWSQQGEQDPWPGRARQGRAEACVADPSPLGGVTEPWCSPPRGLPGGGAMACRAVAAWHLGHSAAR